MRRVIWPRFPERSSHDSFSPKPPHQMAMNAKPLTWAARPLDVDHVAVFSSFERAASVSLIATFEPELKCCSMTDRLADVVSRPDLVEFDFLPVRRGREIVGLLNRAEQASDADPQASHAHRTMSDAMHPLDESILMSSESSLLAFVASADAHPCRLIISETRINGIVTVADIQKLPVRPVLFLLVTHLEMLMAEALRAASPVSEGWLANLKPLRRDALEKKWLALQDRDMALDRLVAAEFCDKKEALIGSGIPLPFGRGKSARQIEKIEELRNGLAHAGEYAGTREAAARCAKTVRLTQSWVAHLSDWLSAHRREHTS